MKRMLLICLALVMILTFSSSLYAESPGIEKFVGKWNLAPNKRAQSGAIEFKANGTYEMTEKLADGTGVGTKGQFKITAASEPYRIDLCLDKCGKPGSEWTTRFGIFRFLSDNELEIRTSPDGKYPSEFSKDKTEDYTMILTR
jgi:hypothetical protein